MSRQRKRTPARPVGSRDTKSRRPAPAARKRPAANTRRTAWIVGGAVAGSDYTSNAQTVVFAGTDGERATVQIDLIGDSIVELDESFGIEDSFGFFAWYGFVSCVGMIVFAKLLGLFLKRPEDYYEKDLNKGEVNHD